MVLRSVLFKANNFSSSLGDGIGLFDFCYLFSPSSLPQSPPILPHPALNIEEFEHMLSIQS